MRYALDTEFIDTPTCSALISLALVGEDGRYAYFEFDYPESEMSDWLNKNVKPNLTGVKTSFKDAALSLRLIVEDTKPEIWAYYGAYDWYWFCRIFGGMMEVPREFENWFHEWKGVHWQPTVADKFGPPHNALNDARSLMASMQFQDERSKQIDIQNREGAWGR